MQQRGELFLLSFPCYSTHAVQSRDSRSPLCVGLLRDWPAFSLVRTLPSATSAKARASLFGDFMGTTAQSDSSLACMSGLWLSAFPDRSARADAMEVSRFSCMLFLDVPGVSDYAGPESGSRVCAGAPCWLPSFEQGRHPGLSLRSSIPSPPMPLSTLHASPRGDPRKTRGQDGVASPFLWGSFIPYNMPVYPGAFSKTSFPELGILGRA